MGKIVLGFALAGIFVCGYFAGRLDGKRAALEPQVERRDDLVELRMGPVGVQTVSRVDGGSTGLYYDWAALVSVFGPVDSPSVLMLGLGGGEMLRVLKRTLHAPFLTAVEIDERVITMALRDFPLNVEDVTVIHADAARYMSKRCDSPRFDAIIVDIYDGPDMPEHFLTPSFYKDVKRCLLPHGMVIVNAKNRELAKVLARALHTAFADDVVAFPVFPTANVILWAVTKDDWGEVTPPAELADGFSKRWTL